MKNKEPNKNKNGKNSSTHLNFNQDFSKFGLQQKSGKFFFQFKFSIIFLMCKQKN